MKSYVNMMIADEYVTSKENAKALALYTKHIPLYEQESWKPLAESIRAKIASIEAETVST